MRISTAEEFEADCTQHYLEESPGDGPGGKPFMVLGGFRKSGILLIHGYLAAPAQVRAMAEYLG